MKNQERVHWHFTKQMLHSCVPTFTYGTYYKLLHTLFYVTFQIPQFLSAISSIYINKGCWIWRLPTKPNYKGFFYSRSPLKQSLGRKPSFCSNHLLLAPPRVPHGQTLQMKAKMKKEKICIAVWESHYCTQVEYERAEPALSNRRGVWISSFSHN